jgi:hypothetical protein
LSSKGLMAGRRVGVLRWDLDRSPTTGSCLRKPTRSVRSSSDFYTKLHKVSLPMTELVTVFDSRWAIANGPASRDRF